MTGRIIPFPVRKFTLEEARAAANRILALSVPERLAKQKELQLEEPETLIEISRVLRDLLETSPTKVREEAEFLFGFLSEPRRSIGLFDEREYFLGEAALLAGTACRLLARRDEAYRWLERSETSFRLTVNPVANWCRVSYQRLALRLEERRFEELLEQLPGLIESCTKEDMAEDALKCRFLEGLAHMEMGDLDSAAEVFQFICVDAKRFRNDKLVATAYTNLAQVFGMLGKTEEALECSDEAAAVFQATGNKFGMAKIQWGMGSLLRERGQFSEAIDAYREAQQRFLELGMVADVAAGDLVVADLLLELGQEASALREILKALPTIDELKMVPEGFAALALLRDSVLHNRINREALRQVHGYFAELK